jgi:WD40 repeat protein
MGKTLHLWDQDGRSLAVLEGHTRNVWGAAELHDGRLLSWSDDGNFRLWDREGNALDYFTIEEGLCRFSEFRINYDNKENNVSWCLLGSIINSGCFTIFNKTLPCHIFWHGNPTQPMQINERFFAIPIVPYCLLRVKYAAPCVFWIK